MHQVLKMTIPGKGEVQLTMTADQNGAVEIEVATIGMSKLVVVYGDIDEQMIVDAVEERRRHRGLQIDYATRTDAARAAIAAGYLVVGYDVQLEDNGRFTWSPR
jgi:hypothetical protein